jgi:hypothetical protein
MVDQFLQTSTPDASSYARELRMRNFNKKYLIVLTIAASAFAPVFGQQKSGKVGNFFKVLSGQPRDSRKVGLAFSSVDGVEIYYPTDWTAEETPPGDWELRLTRKDTHEPTDIHMLERPAYSFDQMRVDETDDLTKNEGLKTAPKGNKIHIGEYKNIPAMEADYEFGNENETLRHVVYFGYPPVVHSLVLNCRPDEYERLKPDFDHILSTISIHDGIH